MSETSTKTSAPAHVTAVALLAEFTQGAPRFGKIDKRETRDLLTRTGAGAAHVYKHTLASDILRKITSAATAAYQTHLDRTLPWGYSTGRVLLSTGIVAYHDAMAQQKAVWSPLVREFGAVYPSLVTQAAAKGVTGSMYDPADYPPTEEVMAKFVLDWRTYQFPLEDRFLAEYTDDVRGMLRTDLEASVRESMEDVTQRIERVVRHMSAKLSEYATEVTNDRDGKAKEKKVGIFRDSLVENVRELADILPHLNLIGEPRLDALARQMRERLCQHDALTLREDEGLRKETAKAADAVLDEAAAILQKMRGYGW